MVSDSMFVQFAISPDALAESDDIDHHERFLRHWLRHGILMRNDERLDQCEVYSTVRALPQGIRTLWMKALKKGWSRSCAGWEGFRKSEEPADFRALDGEIDALVLDETRFELLYEAIAKTYQGWDCSVYEKFDSSRGVKAARDLSEKFVKDITVEQLWKQRFSRMAKMARWVIVVDSYALDYDNVAGLKQFLLRLDAEPETMSKVTIYSAFGHNEQTEEDVSSRVSEIRKKLCRGGVGDIDLWLLESRDFNKHILRDRFIVFDHLVVELGHGVMLFAEQKAHPMTFTSKLKQPEHRQIIEKLRQKASVGSPFRV